MATELYVPSSAHLFLAKRAGMGQSLLASLFADWIRQRGGLNPAVFDMALIPGAGISRFNALHAAHVATKASFHAVDHSIACRMGPHIVDVSSELHLDFVQHMLLRDSARSAAAVSRKLYMHAIITGGAGYAQSLADTEYLANLFPDLPLVVWLNEYHSEASTQIEVVHFLESLAGEKIAQRAIGVVRMHTLTMRERAVLASLESQNQLPSEIQSMGALSSATKLIHKGWANHSFAGLDEIFNIKTFARAA